ncbi:macro domain-containing protein [Microbulbifer agarilyticus]|uniref:macro domain-containing protein n=1 Tax=Microbulbifer agarilyticus TaxID=260552 RepID=UPI001CD53E25|nr:macro domain-containing protein [Microbulbifer agarilyticus]MCA0893365.1 macro domain-containing protein [Microbulbifer agarilyticus]
MGRLLLICEDVLSLEADALVCPAHKHLIRGRGLSAQIYDRAGDELVSECSHLPECPVGEARISAAPNLMVNHLIHTVTPQWSSGDQWGAQGVAQLRACYDSVLALAKERGLRRLLFPALGAGTNRFPHEIAAHQGLTALRAAQDDFSQLTVSLHSRAALATWRKVDARFFSENPNGGDPAASA